MVTILAQGQYIRCEMCLGKPIDLKIMLLNRQIHEEAAKSFYGEKAFLYLGTTEATLSFLHSTSTTHIYLLHLHRRTPISVVFSIKRSESMAMATSASSEAASKSMDDAIARIRPTLFALSTQFSRSQVSPASSKRLRSIASHRSSQEFMSCPGHSQVAEAPKFVYLLTAIISLLRGAVDENMEDGPRLYLPPVTSKPSNFAFPLLTRRHGLKRAR